MKKQRLLNVAGEGRIQLAADIADVRLSVVTEAKTAGEAVAANAKLAGALVEEVERLGISRDRMRTDGLNLYPVYEVEQPTGISRIAGYRAEDTVAVRAAVEIAGKVFDAGIAAGANQSSGISFGLADPGVHRQKALEEAVKSARAEAETVARAMGVELAGPRSIDIDPGGAPSGGPRMFMAKDAATTPVLPGQMTVAATVRVAFECRTPRRKQAEAKAEPAPKAKRAKGSADSA